MQVLPGGIDWVLWLFLGFILVLLAGTSVYVVKQWEQVAVIRLGRIIKVVKDGVHFRIPLLDSLSRFDMRVRTLDLRQQSVITKDNISLMVSGASTSRTSSSRTSSCRRT
jgi:membrane protease subunit HflC